MKFLKSGLVAGFLATATALSPVAAKAEGGDFIRSAVTVNPVKIAEGMLTHPITNVEIARLRQMEDFMPGTLNAVRLAVPQVQTRLVSQTQNMLRAAITNEARANNPVAQAAVANNNNRNYLIAPFLEQARQDLPGAEQAVAENINAGGRGVIQAIDTALAPPAPVPTPPRP